MTDDPMIFEWIRKRLDPAIEDYLRWMERNGYSEAICKAHRRSLQRFTAFIGKRKCSFDQIFTKEVIGQFKKTYGSDQLNAVYGLAWYLFDQKKISRRLSVPTTQMDLSKIYEDYLFYDQQQRQWADRNARQNRRVLCAFHEYLLKESIDLKALSIEAVDAFLAQFFAPLNPSSQRAYRSKIRGFLTYLYQRGIIKRDLASLIVAQRHYGLSMPPKFLRPQEIKTLFAGINLTSDSHIRTYAMMHLAYSLGLRPKEIALLSLNDICFSKAELTLTERKNTHPTKLPIPDATLKAVAAYRIAVRPESKHNALFLSLQRPYRPATPNTIGYHIRKAMRAAGLLSTTYWLRHTYAQNLLESGASVFEIKEMLGHDDIESTQKYLRVHIKLMAKVLFDETF
jgi:site-specific recombinase XerD